MAQLPDLYDINRGLLRNMMRDFENIFDRMRSDWRWPSTDYLTPSLLEANFDFEESDDNYYIRCELPGVHKEDVKVDVGQEVITIAAQIRETHDGQQNRRVRGGATASGRILRTFSLPADVDSAHVQAFYENGVLEVTLPKSAERQMRTVDIKEGHRPALKGTEVGQQKTTAGRTITTPNTH